MPEREQILYMQLRIMTLAMFRWKKSPAQVAEIFRKYGLASFIEENFDLYHMEGDEAVYDDMIEIIRVKGAVVFD